MAKYFYFFDNEEDASAWVPPENQSWVAYCEAFGVGYSSDMEIGQETPNIPVTPVVS